MKLQLITSICKSAVMLILLTAIIQLSLKSIVPIYTILLLLLVGGIIRFLIRMASLLAVAFIILILLKMLL